MECETMEVVVLAEEPVVFAFAVAHISDDRTGDVLQMTPQLMEPSGARARFHPGVAAVLGEATNLRDRRLQRTIVLGTQRMIASAARTLA